VAQHVGLSVLASNHVRVPCAAVWGVSNPAVILTCIVGACGCWFIVVTLLALHCRWQNTPVDEAKRVGAAAVIEYLQAIAPEQQVRQAWRSDLPQAVRAGCRQ
jgi:hypothetical protein